MSVVKRICSTSGVLLVPSMLFNRLLFLAGRSKIPDSKLLTGVKLCLCTVLVTGMVEYNSSKLYMVFQHLMALVCSSAIRSNGALVKMKESCTCSCNGDSWVE